MRGPERQHRRARRLEAAGFDDEEILPRWVVELPDDLDALRSGWRKTSNNLFRSLRKADRSELGFREVASGPRPAQPPRAVRAHHARTPLTAAHAAPAAARARPARARTCKMFIVHSDGRDVAGGVYHVFGDTIELVYNGSDERCARACVPTMPSTGA